MDEQNKQPEQNKPEKKLSRTTPFISSDCFL